MNSNALIGSASSGGAPQRRTTFFPDEIFWAITLRSGRNFTARVGDGFALYIRIETVGMGRDRIRSLQVIDKSLDKGEV
jgi:hypothetical protein